MSAWVCANCTAAYSVGAPRCPQCGVSDPRALDDVADSAAVIIVRCPGRDCEAYGVERAVRLRIVAVGVIERPMLHCATCDRAMEIVRTEKGDAMPKSTVHTGPSNASVERGEPSSPTPEAPGTSSSTSSEKDAISPETSTNAARSHARTTGNRSAKARTGASTAHGTDGDQTAPTSDQES